MIYFRLSFIVNLAGARSLSLLPVDRNDRLPPSSQLRLGELSRPPLQLHFCALIVAFLFLAPTVLCQQLPREQWGAMLVKVSQHKLTWVIEGKRTTVTLNKSDLSVTAHGSTAQWNMVGSTAGDIIVKSGGKEASLRLADAKQISIAPYDAGFKTGIKISLSGWTDKGRNLDLQLFLTICLEGANEEVVFNVAAKEKETVLRQLDWPSAVDARDVDYTLLSNGRGTLLPRNWPKEYYPIRSITPEGKIAATDHSVLQSHVIESWSMSWWGFQKGRAAMMLIVETPDDAAYQFKHPAGGPTVIGPRWRAQLGRFGYSRSVRMVLVADGNYVDLAKRYRRYVMESGLFVSLKEKIARTPLVGDLIGTPHTRVSILRNRSVDSDRYDTKDPSQNYLLTTFEERARNVRDLKSKGFDRALVYVSGWPQLGYDRQHPDPLPPPEKAGGWAGLKKLVDACREIGYPVILHDQYRDYYLDTASYDPQFAVHEEDDSLPPKQFPGSRFGDFKQDNIPMMRHWDGGKQAYLNARFQFGHLLKNYQLFFQNEIKTQGIYIDVIGYVPPDEDFNPEHPTTHSDAMRAQIAMLNWSRHNLGITATESGADWTVPFVDVVNSSGGGSKAILVPLYNLVYHDAVIVSFGARDEKTLLQGLLFGGVPEIPVDVSTVSEKSLNLMRQMTMLHKRVALFEMTRHEFLDANFRKERTTFADRTTVTVDWNRNSVEIEPELR